MDVEKEINPKTDIDAQSTHVVDSEAHSDEPPVELVLPRWRLVCLTISLFVGLFLSLLDTTIVATAIYTIGEDFQSVQKVTWVALAYTLAYLSFCITIGRLADIFGRRNVWIVCLILFLGFSLGCGFSQNLNALIACRAMQGIGGSGLYSLTFVILPEISPPNLLGLFAGIVGAVVACSGVLGPVLGGIITQYTTWRWIFWINAPVGIIPLAMFIIAWPKPNMILSIEKRPFREFDFVGSALVIVASVLVVFPFQESVIKSNIWNTALFICPLVLGCIFWGLLFGWEVLVSRFWGKRLAGMLPLHLVKRRVYLCYVITIMLMCFPYFLIVYALPLRIHIVNGKSTLVAGVGLLPMLGSVAVGSLIGGALNTKKNNTFPVLLTASCLMVLGTGLMSTLSVTTNIESKTYGFQVLVGLAFGLAVSTISIGAWFEADLNDITVAQGLIAQMCVLGGSIGIAASTAILGVRQRSELVRPGIVTEDQLIILPIIAPVLSQRQLLAVRQTYSDAFNEEMRVCAIISAVSVLVTLGAFKKNRQSLMERRTELVRIAQKRARELEMKASIAVASSLA